MGVPIIRTIVYWGLYWGPLNYRRDPSIQIITIMENPMEKNMEHEMATGVFWGLYGDPRIQIIPTLGPKVYEYYLH